MKELIFSESLVGMLPKFISHIEIINGEIMVYVRSEHVAATMFFLKHHTLCQYRILSDLCGVDYLMRKNRFEVVYNLLSIGYNNRLRVKVSTSEFATVPSITNVYSSAAWYERETWDMFGIFFSDHPDLRRLLSDYGFRGYPLRKDFPLTGYYEIRYDDEKKRIVSEPVEIAQEFREFDFSSPWESVR